MGFSDLKINSSSSFLKIESGQPQDVRILQETPMERFIHGFGKEEQECTGEDCPLCADPENQARQRFAINVYNHALKKVMAWEFGPSIAKQLQSIAKAMEEEKKNLMDIDLRVDAEGSNLAKRYKITPRMTSKDIPGGLKLLPLKGELPF